MTCPRCNAPADEQTLREFGGVCPKCLLDFSEEQDAPAFPNLEILEMIGQGGMGVVYKARQKNLDRIVALKVLSPHLSDDPEFVERFTREAKALAQLSHPNIVGIHDSGIHDRVPYLVMEYVDGTPLRKVLGAKLTPDKALEVIPQICDALQYAHTHGVVHRDIKPENILIDRQGRVKIADFGLAKLSKVEETRITQSGYVMGTPRYMAPEQFDAAGRVDHRADIYSLGVVFYEMLTGEVPMGRFKPPSAKADVDRRLDPVVLKSLEREPEDRYQSAGEVKEDVAGLNARRRERPAPPPQTRSNNLRKASGIIAVLAVMALGMSVLFGYFGWPIAKVSVIVGCSLLLSSFVVYLFSLVFKPASPSPSSGGCLLPLVAGLACIIVLAMVFLLAVARPVAQPAQVVTAPAYPTPVERAPDGFRLADAWPALESLPKHLEIEEVEPAQAKKELGLDPGGLAEIREIRKWHVIDRGSRQAGDDHRCVIIGIEFRSDAALDQWEGAIRKQGHRSQFLGGRTIIWMQHDESLKARQLYHGLVPLLAENVRAAIALEAARRRAGR